MDTLPAQQRAQNIFSQGKPLDENEIRALMQNDQETAVSYVSLLQLKAKMGVSSTTPSGMIPPYQKESSKGKKKKPGRKAGHEGSRRKEPPQIDRKEEHHLERCPDCDSPLQENKKGKKRTRIIEDIPKDIKPEVVEHSIHQYYCPCCKKPKEPKVPDAMPRSTIGNRTVALSAYLHYGLGLTGSQIVETLNHHLQFPLTEGGLVQMWHRLADTLLPWYEQITQEALRSAVLHADETGWRVNGKTHWLWCFCAEMTTLYLVDPNRSNSILNKFFQDGFQGTLVTDFFRAYDCVTAANRQYCIAHLLSDLKRTNDLNDSEEWKTFSKRVKKLFQDALRLRAKEDYSPEKYQSRIDRLHKRLLDLALSEYQDHHAKRIAKRLDKYWDDLFTFLEHPEVPATNNHGEREIRFAVLIRKITYGNRSDRGARTQSILMSIMRTLKLRGYNPIEMINNALREFILTNQLPPFPPVLG